MNKPTVHYRGEPQFLFKCALLVPVDHPNHILGHNVSNNDIVMTSGVIDYDKESGRIETRNTIYVPLKEEDHAQV